MKPSEIAIALQDCIAISQPTMIWGPPGVGKSDAVRQTAQSLGVDLIDFRAALRDAVDIMGLPYTSEDSSGRRITNYAMPAGLPRDGRGVLFLDEVNSAPQQTQAALYQLVLDRAVGDYRLPDGWAIIAAGNRVNDRGVVHRMPDPLADRFLHLNYETELKDWCTWALTNNILPEVIAFLRFRPEVLHHQDPARECVAFSTPRGWAAVSKILSRKSPVEAHLIRGRVGEHAAGEFLAFLSLFRNMVSPDQILANPLQADVPSNPSILYALAEALARRAEPKNLDKVAAYAGRMPPEYQACLMSSAVLRTSAIANTHEYIAWANANQ